MPDLLKIARERCEKLSAETEEAEALVQSAEHFIKSIQKFRERIPHGPQKLEEFVRNGWEFLQTLRQVRTENQDEIEKLRTFISCGEELLNLGQDAPEEPAKPGDESDETGTALPGADQGGTTPGVPSGRGQRTETAESDSFMWIALGPKARPEADNSNGDEHSG